MPIVRAVALFIVLIACMVGGIFAAAGFCAIVYGPEILETALGKPPNREHPAFWVFMLVMVPGMVIGAVGALFGVMLPVASRWKVAGIPGNWYQKKLLSSYLAFIGKSVCPETVMSQTIIVVDAFTDKPFAGNPAAVCVLEGPADETWMKQVAAEMNLSETAFLHPEADGWRLRWLTPTVEVDLCGHATLASAHVLWESGRLKTEQAAVFHTRSGRLSAMRRGNAIALDFPAKPPKECAPPDGLLSALGVTAQYIGSNGMDYFVEVTDEDAVCATRPDCGQIAKLPVRGVIVTGRPTKTPDVDFVSRFFAPAAGVAEDPVTGSAHCALAPYWAAKLGKKEMRGYQASARGGYVGVVIDGDRVQLVGNAVTVLRAELLFQ